MRCPARSELDGESDEPNRETLPGIRDPSIRDQARLDRLRAAIAVADDQIARGEIIDWTPDFMDRLMREAAENVRAGKPIKEEVQP